MKLGRNIETRILSDLIIYSIGNIVHKSLSFFVIFFLTKNLTVENFGIIDFFISTISFVSMIVIFGQDTALSRFFSDKSNYKKKKTVSQSLVIYILNIFFFFPILFLYIFFISDRNVLSENIEVLTLSSFSIFFLVFLNFCQTILKYNFETLKYNILNIIHGSLFFFSVIFLIYNNKLNYKYVLLLYCIVNFTVLLLGIFFIKKWIIFQKKKLINYELINFAIPLGLVAILFNITLIYERYFILSNTDFYHLGIYSLAVKVSIIIQTIIFGLLACWEPYFFSNIKNKNNELNFNLAFKFIIFFSFITFFAINSFKQTIVSVISNENYSEAGLYIFPILITVMFHELVRIPNSIIAAKKKTFYLFLVQLFYFLLLLVTLNLLSESVTLLQIVYIISIICLIKFVVSSYIAVNKSEFRLYASQIILLIIIFLLLGYLIYEIELLNFDAISKFFVLFLISSCVLFFFLNVKEIKIIKNILINFF